MLLLAEPLGRCNSPQHRKLPAAADAQPRAVQVPEQPGTRYGVLLLEGLCWKIQGSAIGTEATIRSLSLREEIKYTARWQMAGEFCGVYIPLFKSKTPESAPTVLCLNGQIGCMAFPVSGQLCLQGEQLA